MLRFPSNPQVSVRKGELLYLPAMWYHRVAQKGVSWLTVFFFRFFQGVGWEEPQRWLEVMMMLITTTELPWWDDPKDPWWWQGWCWWWYSKMKLSWYPTLFTFNARLQLQWTIGMICKLAMLFLHHQFLRDAFDMDKFPWTDHHVIGSLDTCGHGGCRDA